MEGSVYTPLAASPDWECPLRVILRWRTRALVAEERRREAERRLEAYRTIYEP